MSTSVKTWSQMLAEIQAKNSQSKGPALLKRKFLSLEGDSASGKSQTTVDSIDKREGSVRVMQWNVLAQGLCLGSDNFILCPPEALRWDRRQTYILEELLVYDPDLLCLEEVDHYQLADRHLAQLGYRSAYLPKPDSPCLYQDGNLGPDGCAVFWRESLFRLKSREDLVLRNDADEETNQVALLVWLEGVRGSSMEGKSLLLATTHLKAKAQCGDIRFQQGKFLERELLKRTTADGAAGSGHPLIVCGDFNDDPDSKVIKDVMKSSKLALASAYTGMSASGQEEPPYTTWKVRSGKGPGAGQVQQCHTIDYVFYTPANTRCLQLLQFPTEDELKPGFLPSFAYPSDHLSLVADFVFT